MVESSLESLRLSGLKTSNLPAVSALADELTPLITNLLQEAIPLLDSVTAGQDSLWKSKGTKNFPESSATIDLSERVVDSETWACRRSVHPDAATRGSASWAEFARCLRDEHAATEDAFTPTVLAHRQAQVWAAAGDVASVTVAGKRWGGFVLALVEMKHKIPSPLQPRVFPVLQLIATRVEDERMVEDFVVVSIPVGDLAEHAELGLLSRDKGTVVGAYAAVERVRRIGEELGAKRGEIEWSMATTSDARGVLPMWMQNKAVPGQIARDVPLFLGWIDSERKEKK